MCTPTNIRVRREKKCVCTPLFPLAAKTCLLSSTLCGRLSFCVRVQAVTFPLFSVYASKPLRFLCTRTAVTCPCDGHICVRTSHHAQRAVCVCTACDLCIHRLCDTRVHERNELLEAQISACTKHQASVSVSSWCMHSVWFVHAQMLKCAYTKTEATTCFAARISARTKHQQRVDCACTACGLCMHSLCCTHTQR